MDALSTTLRDATPADRPWLLDAVAALNDHERTLHDTRVPGRDMAADYLALVEEKIATHRAAIVVAEREGRLVGYMTCRVEHGDTPAETPDSTCFGYVSDIFVVEAERRRGIAGLLLAEAESRLRALGVTRLRIGSLATNRAAIDAYRKAGFGDYEVVLEKHVAAVG